MYVAQIRFGCRMIGFPLRIISMSDRIRTRFVELQVVAHIRTVDRVAPPLLLVGQKIGHRLSQLHVPENNSKHENTWNKKTRWTKRRRRNGLISGDAWAARCFK
jgi:hypothetical protein